ncbi:adenylate/guanylate cyclase domain-containing protein [Hoyosella rhizosphaerae]|uniref:Adenylate cyclase n=1 Tax=Hoyosella rhizosphaerae TaxID=1755582 RepID=A0A916UMB6_9ACTN|nr:adenylate/guanylate cyclase domain-containing protein [Hoyosella rhizosphaerae]MBN4925342.1 adenylate/guanylate cyclase domain-containing protein [Hoyosella rhizosphaerae]GGC76054.1 adenylate cyclase [Hoyosella rhizosphaerae]
MRGRAGSTESFGSVKPLLRGSFTRPWPLYVFGMQVANVAGAVFVFGFLQFLLPGEDALRINELLTSNRIEPFLAYLVLTAVVSSAVAWWLARPVIVWQQDWQKEPHGLLARDRALKIPQMLAWVYAAVWVVGGVIFVALTAQTVELAVITAVTVAIGGATACAVGYLFSERVLRPVHASAMAVGDASLRHPPSVSSRLQVGWVVSVLVPVAGILVVTNAALTGSLTADSNAVLTSILALCAALVLGSFVVTRLTASAIADPIAQLRSALRRVQSGDFDTPVRIYDATELGQLQAGFNEMVQALAEREQIRDVFGRYVGPDVARRALNDGVQLGGEDRFVSVLFVDLVGSTNLATKQPPAEIVALLNEFFRVVVDVVDRHDGLLNKFLGDAALAVFGAPLEHQDASGAALAAARELAQRLPYVLHAGSDTEPVGFGIGVAAGPVVAGNIGAAHRLEYTVIGDPVNEAARITELAKDEPGGALASSFAVSRAHHDEAAKWTIVRSVELRGRGVPSELAAPTQPHHKNSGAL